MPTRRLRRDGMPPKCGSYFRSVLRIRNPDWRIHSCGNELFWLFDGYRLISLQRPRPPSNRWRAASIRSESRQIAQMLGDQPFAFGPKIDDRAGWQRLAATKAYARAVKDAEKALAKPMPEMTEELYMLFKKTGRRTAEYGKVRSDRYGRITRYARAECIENKGRFIKPLEAVLQSICAEKTWIYNFHDRSLDDYNGKKITIDLGSADLAQNLGECLYLLGDRLGPETRQLVMARLRERIFDPYREAVDGTGMRQWWITADMNWNSVCHAGVVAAALAVCPDRNERAFFRGGGGEVLSGLSQRLRRRRLLRRGHGVLELWLRQLHPVVRDRLPGDHKAASICTNSTAPAMPRSIRCASA